jgi:hypothetical protein
VKPQLESRLIYEPGRHLLDTHLSVVTAHKYNLQSMYLFYKLCLLISYCWVFPVVREYNRNGHRIGRTAKWLLVKIWRVTLELVRTGGNSLSISLMFCP